MDWDALQLEAKGKGWLVFAMDQAQTPLAKNAITKGTFEGGYCLGLSTTWIKYQYDGENFPTVGDVCDSPPLAAGLVHVAVDIGGDVKNWYQWWARTTTLELMSISDGLRASRDHKPTASFIYSMVTKAYGCYAVSISGPGGAHAVALRHGRDNKMHFFDPNYGHFRVNDHTQLKGFLNWFLTKSDYENQFTSFVGVVGVRPWINFVDAIKAW